MRRSFLALLVLPLALNACSTSSTTPGPTPTPTPLPPTHLYVASDSTTALVYALPLTNTSMPVVTLSGFTAATGVALDKLNHVFVVDNGPSPALISEYALPLTATSLPIATIHTPAGTNARALAVDAGNNLWVPSLSGSIYELVGPFSGSVTPAPSITLTSGLAGPEGLTFDSLGNLYAVNNGGVTVAIFDAPLTNAEAVSGTLAGIAGDSRGVAIDGAGHAYVLEDAGNIDRFNGPPPFTSGVTPSFTDPSANTGLTFGGGLGVDASGNLYACDFTAGLFVFANAQTSFTATSTPSVHVTQPCANVAAGP